MSGPLNPMRTQLSPTFWDLVVRAVEERPEAPVASDDHGRSLTRTQIHDAAEAICGRALSPRSRDGNGRVLATADVDRGRRAPPRIGPDRRGPEPVDPHSARAGGGVHHPTGRHRVLDRAGGVAWLPARGNGAGACTGPPALRDGDRPSTTWEPRDPATGSGCRQQTRTRLARQPQLDGPRWIYYSSGTTADPKGARHTDASIMASANALLELMGLGEKDVYPIPWPLTHIGGASVLATSLRGGVHLVLFDTFDPARRPAGWLNTSPRCWGPLSRSSGPTWTPPRGR